MKIFFIFSICYMFLNNIYIICDETKQTCFEYSCEICTTTEYGQCTKCRDGFYLIDGTCPCYDHRCALCTTGLYTTNACLLCKNGYLNINNDCNSEIENCAVVDNNNECSLCYDGYNFNSVEKKCEKETEDNKRHCNDSNCEICLSEEKGTCESCASGYKLEKGTCVELPKPDENNQCNDGYYYKNGICEQICYGLHCNEIPTSTSNVFRCSENNCLACQNQEIRHIVPCNASKVCTKDGCLNCLSDDDCLICGQGYYLINGECKKCINGCSLCADSQTCQYCFSGYNLDSENKCVKDNQFDYNVNLYHKKKIQLIKINFPYELITEDEEQYTNVKECDSNCVTCDDSSGICKACKSLYVLEDNNCIMTCSDNKCLYCRMYYFSELCDICPEGYYSKGKNCYLKCSDENCKYCRLFDDQEVCTECNEGYELEGITCKLKRNYMAIIYTIITFLILAIFIICFCWYKQKKIQQRQEQVRLRIMQNNLNSVNVYSRHNMELESGARVQLSKEAISDEFEKQKAKYEKDKPLCQFCNKKTAKYKCDCDCIVCKEHSALKKEEGDGENYKVCFNCGKVVKKVVPIKQDCNICLEKKITLAHFACNCALLACKECYLKCRLESDKCPGCRANI